MKKSKDENIQPEVGADETGLKPFFFPREDRTIMAKSLAEAQDVLAKEQAEKM